MWQIDKIKAENFLVFKSMEVSLVKGETTFILGEIDSPSSNSNGAGKSSALAAFPMALLDSPEKGKTKDDYIKWGDKSGFLSLEMSNDFTKEQLKIDRILYRGTKTNSVHIELNGINLTPDFVSVQAANSFITEKIGIDKSELLKYFLISKENKSFFLQSNDTEKKGVIWKFAGTDKLDDLISFVESKINLKTEERDLKYKSLKAVDDEISLLQKEVDLSKRISEKDNREELIKDLEETKSTKQKELKNTKIKLNNDDYANEIEKLEASINKEGKYLEIEEFKFKKIKDKLHKIERELKKAQVALSGTVECPQCKFEFSPELELDSQSIQDTANKLEILQSKYTVELKTQKASVEIVEQRIIELKSDKEDFKYKIKHNQYQQRRIEELQSDIYDIDRRITKLRDKKDIVFDTSEIESRIEKLSLKKEALQKIVQKSEDQLLSLKGARDKISKSFKAYLVNKGLSVLEEIMNKKLRILQFEYVVKLQGFKVLKSGEIRENISVFVSKDEENWFSFNSLSEGQKMRISLASIIAIQDIKNNASESGGIDILILDEAFDGLDETGQDMAIKLLQQTQRTILAVTHHRMEYEGNTLTVKHKNGNSYIYGKDIGVKKGRKEEIG
jgi:DNA repair exonuclease SbcCD ATPase subunit